MKKTSTYINKKLSPNRDPALQEQVRQWLFRRLKAGLKQYELAKLAGMSAHNLCFLEKGRILPKPQTVARVEKVFKKYGV